jgi:hypothetical protein
MEAAEQWEPDDARVSRPKRLNTTGGHLSPLRHAYRQADAGVEYAQRSTRVEAPSRRDRRRGRRSMRIATGEEPDDRQDATLPTPAAQIGQAGWGGAGAKPHARAAGGDRSEAGGWSVETTLTLQLGFWACGQKTECPWARSYHARCASLGISFHNWHPD